MGAEPDSFRLGFAVMVVEVVADPVPAAAITDLFADSVIRTDGASPDVRSTVAHVRITDESGAFAIRGLDDDGDDLTMATLVDRFVAGVNRAAVEHAGDRLSLHAAVLERDGEALVVLGDTGAGKSTAALALMRRGWRYLTDEIAWVPPGARTVSALSKPLTLKPGTRDLFADVNLSSIATSGPSPATEPARSYVRADRLGSTVVGPLVPRAVAVLRDGGDSIEPIRALRGCEAVRAVVENAFDIDRLGGAEGLRRAAELVAACPVLEVTGATLDERVGALESSWGVPAPHRAFAPLTPVAGVDGSMGPGLRWVAGLHGVVVDGSAVLRIDAAERLVTIDPMPLGLWEALDGSSGLEGVIEAVATAHGLASETVADDIAALVATLSEQSVVDGDPKWPH